MNPFVYRTDVTPNSDTVTAPRPLRRRFISYEIIDTSTGDLELIETFEQYDTLSRTYVRQELRTTLPISLTRKVASASRNELTQLCIKMRREIDTNELKIFFDPLPDNELRAKWRYRVQGRTRTDYLTVISDSTDSPNITDENPDTITTQIIDLVRRNRDYYLTTEWRKWLGRKMQRKREEIIFNLLADKFGSTETTLVIDRSDLNSEPEAKR